MKIKDRIRRSIANRKDKAFLRSEFDRFGSSASVNMAMRELVQDGFLVRVGMGVYVPGERASVDEKAYPKYTPIEWGEAALRKLGVAPSVSRDRAMYNAGLTTQLPAGVVMNVGSSRVQRRLAFGRIEVGYERN
jgi:hypothetical protein